MSYRTTCPQCTSVFRLGEDQIAAAGGWVQCGVCGTAFDARLNLQLENGAPLPSAAEPEPAETPALQQSESAEAAPPATDSTAADLARGIAQREEPLELPSIILIDPDAAAPDEPGPLPEIPPAAQRPSRPGPADIPRFEPVATPVRNPPSARIEYASPQPQPATGRRIMPWIWGLVSLVLLAALLGQTTYFLRDTLASKLPQTRPALEQACGMLGCTLSLPKNLSLLQIIGSDLQTEAEDQLRLSLTLGNRAAHAQAWPVLVLTLTDQRNRPLARRSFAPSEYLGDPQRIAAGIPPRSEQPLSLPLTVSKLAPMGFSLQLVY